MRVGRLAAGPVAAVLLAGLLGPGAQAAEVATAAVPAKDTTPLPGPAVPGPTAGRAAVTPRITPLGDVPAVPRLPSWWRLVEPGGKALAVARLSRGPRAGQRAWHVVVGKKYVLRGRVPAAYRTALAGKRLVVQVRSARGGSWKYLAGFAARGDGRFAHGVRLPKALLGGRDFRIVAVDGAGLARRATALPGGTLTATVNVAFWLSIHNDTSQDLVFNFPTWVNSGDYAEGAFPLPAGTTSTMQYVNAIADVTTIGGYAVRLNCTFGCNKFLVNWDHAPNKNYTPCNTVMPTFASGSSYTLRVTPQAITSGYDTFLLDGSGNVICTGSLDTKVSIWFGNHPVAKWATVVLTVAAAVVVVWYGIAAVAALGGAEVYAEIVVEEPTAEDEIQCRIWNLYARTQAASFATASNCGV